MKLEREVVRTPHQKDSKYTAQNKQSLPSCFIQKCSPLSRSALLYPGMLSNRSPNLFPHPDHPHYLCYFIYRCSLRAKLLTPSKMSIRYSSKQSFSQGTLPLGIEDTTSNMPASALYNPHNLRHSTNLQSCKRNRGMAHCFTNFDYNEVHLRKPQNFRATEVHKRPR